jgi:hypothetical protein
MIYCSLTQKSNMTKVTANRDPNLNPVAEFDTNSGLLLGIVLTLV